VAGPSGSGKTTLARRLGTELDLPVTELDGLFHGPNWTPRPEFEAEARALADSRRWVTEFQYELARPVLLARCHLLVVLLLPRRVVMTRVVRRTVRRRITRETLWNGNTETSLWHAAVGPDGIIRWAWQTHADTAHRLAEIGRARPELPVVVLPTPAAVQRWLSGPVRAAAMSARGRDHR